MENKELINKTLDKADDAIASFQSLLEAIPNMAIDRTQERKITEVMINIVAKVTEYKTLRELFK